MSARDQSIEDASRNAGTSNAQGLRSSVGRIFKWGFSILAVILIILWVKDLFPEKKTASLPPPAPLVVRQQQAVQVPQPIIAQDTVRAIIGKCEKEDFIRIPVTQKIDWWGVDPEEDKYRAIYIDPNGDRHVYVVGQPRPKLRAVCFESTSGKEEFVNYIKRLK